MWKWVGSVGGQRGSLTARAASLLLALLIGGPLSAVPPEDPAPGGHPTQLVQVRFTSEGATLPPGRMLPPELASATLGVAPLFGLSRETLSQLTGNGRARSRRALADLNAWHEIRLKPGVDPVAFSEALMALEHVEVAEPAPLPAPPPGTTPDLEPRQGHLAPATDGVDARYAWTLPGGNGSGVTIYDVEYSWNQDHEDLSAAWGVTLLVPSGASAMDPFDDDNHGTAVLGELVADRDGKGVTGIVWGADVGLAPASYDSGYDPATAILLAVADGRAGDVILLEQQYWVCGPEVASLGFGPVEWITSVFDAIATATANGFIVVEAAGNGGVDLDSPECLGRFDRGVRDSGAIIVGAGGSPLTAADRQRLRFSSHGSRVDLQGWGERVFTTGYGNGWFDRDDPSDPDIWYTSVFNGTSSASPMVAAAAASLQGIALALGGGPLDAATVAELLVDTGSPQLGDASEHIGPRPDLRAAIEALLAPQIDIRPESDLNVVNPASRGVIPVAILGSASFDVSDVAPETLAFGPAAAFLAHVKGPHFADVNDDGLTDLLAHFRTQETGLGSGNADACLGWESLDGTAYEACDAILVVPACGIGFELAFLLPPLLWSHRRRRARVR